MTLWPCLSQEVLHVLRVAGSEALLSLSRPAASVPSDSDSDSDSDSTDSAAESGRTAESGWASRSSLQLPLDTESHGVSRPHSAAQSPV